MRSLLIALALAVSAGEAAAQARDAQLDRIERRYPLRATGSIKLFNLSGSLHIIGWDKDTVVVTGTAARGARFYGGGSRDGIKLGIEGSDPDRTPAADLVVRIPATANVWARGANTTITIEGMIGGVDVGAVAGNVKVMGAPRELLVETMDGDCEIVGSPGVLRARTASGALTWRGGGPEATLTTVSGRVLTLEGSIGRARIESVSGDVVLRGALRADASVTVESHSGQVTLKLSRDVPVRLVADVPRVSGYGVVVEASAPKGARPAARMLEYNKPKSGGRAAEVSVRSFKGELVIEPPEGTRK